jgi:cytochrome c oxidase cbb3-type subunit 3
MRADARTRWILRAAVAVFAVVAANYANSAATAYTGSAASSIVQTSQAPPRRAPARPAPARGAPADAEAVTKRICGTACHPIEHATSIRRTRGQWEATVENMIGRGAKGTAGEFATIIEYLAANFGLSASPVRGAAGPDDKPMVDPKASEMGKPLFKSDCEACHGADARGTSQGANLVRSPIVLRDRYGSAIGPYLRGSHPPVPAPTKLSALTDTQVLILAHFLRDRLNDTLRGAPGFKPGDVLTGDAKAGEAYFNGEGGCAQCHSATGDLAAIGRRMDPVTLQQRFLFPSNAGSRRRTSAAPVVTVTVTTDVGETLSGELVQMDDFTVGLRDASGTYRSVRRTPGVRVVKNDPYAAHVELLSKITDKAIHDVVAYLETLK